LTNILKPYILLEKSSVKVAPPTLQLMLYGRVFQLRSAFLPVCRRNYTFFKLISLAAEKNVSSCDL